ncbi:hypothetical protein [Flavobacterium sp. JP2137]|uniref:hypothetical protein n=1 Tax=Flavobacterium sp. JP2137 TaxID=3414510 RepID=UPI003D300DA7
MKKKLLPLAALFVSGMVYSQVGIGTHYPDKSAQLEISSDDKGVLIPRIALSSTTDATSITEGNVESLLVYNKSSVADVTPGYYYWYRNRWVRIVSDEDTALFLNTSNVKLSVINGELVLEDTEGHKVSVLLTDIAHTEVVTTLVNNGNGNYTYTNEAGDTVDIDVLTDVTTNFEEIINNTNVQNHLNQFITKVEGNVSFDGDNFTYVDGSGNVQIIDITELVKAAETLTTLVQDGTTKIYTYTNEAGATVQIDVAADVTNKFEEIINNTHVQDILNQYFSKIEGNVSFDGDNFTFVDGSGNVQIIDITELVKAAETLTTLVQDGTTKIYTYTNEAGATVQIDVAADVTNKFEEIINNTHVQDILNQYITKVEGNVSFDGDNFTYVDGSGNVQIIDITELVKAAETLTTLVQDGTTKIYTYTNEAGATVQIDVAADVTNKFEEIINNTHVQDILNQYITKVEGNVSFDGDNFTYVDGSGTVQIIDITELVKAAETLTTLVQDGTTKIYTYTNEAGATVQIDVAADVTNKFEEIINNTNVQDILNQYFSKIEGNVSFDGDNFTYVDGSGNVQIIDITELVKAAETLTTLVQDGTTKIYTYTNEAGATVQIDVAADVTNKFEEIINNTHVQDILNQYITKVEGNVSFDGNNFTYVDGSGTVQIIDITELVKAAETLTTLVQDGTTRIYTYTNEAGDKVDIDVAADVTNKFEEIINNTHVQDILNQYFSKIEGNVSFDGDNFTYYDENGAVQIIDITELVKAAETLTTLVQDGTTKIYTYTNEAGATVQIDVAADVTNKFEEIINNTNVQDILNQYFSKIEGNVSFDGDNFTYYDENGAVQIIDITELVKAAETLTTLVQDGTTKIYTYTNEAGDKVDIDVAADVTNKFEEIINNTNVQDILNQYFSKIEGNVSFDGDNFTYYDENGAVQIIDITELVKAAETLTTLVQDVTTKVFTYSNEAGDKVDIDIPAAIVHTTNQDYIDYMTDFVETKQTLTTLTDIITAGFNEEGEEIEVHTLTYTDEMGIANPVDIRVLVKGTETITEMTYDPVTHKLAYTNEKNVTTEFSLVDMIGEIESLTTLELDVDEKKLVYTDEKQLVHTLDLAPIIQEPWYSTATHIGAVSNTDNIYTNGWVGIGYNTASDVPNEKLRVNGSISTVNSSYADYVFEDYYNGFSEIKLDYQFKNLDAVEAFIKTNRHLPGITPIHELAKTAEGYAFNLSELSIQLLEKTEELYLHLIEQKNQIEVKDVQIQQLERANQTVQDRLTKLEGLLLVK